MFKNTLTGSTNCQQISPPLAMTACIIVLVLADIGFVGEADTTIGAFTIAMVWPALAPVMLLPLAVIQDAPGHAGIWWYIGFVLVGSVLIVNQLWGEACKDKINIGQDRAWGLAAIIVIFYAIGVSLLQDATGHAPQSISRQPLIVGGLMIFMVVTGLIMAAWIREQRNINFIIISLAGILVTHGLLVAFIQASFSPTILASKHGLEVIAATKQLIKPAEYGFPRITGTFLTPNGFALGIVFLLLLDLVVRGKQLNWHDVLCWSLIGGVLIVFTLSKAIAILIILGAGYLLIQKTGWMSILILSLVGIGFGLSFQERAFAGLSDAFRISVGTSGESLRAQAWNTVLQDLNWNDWVFGTGLSYWQVLFEQNIGYRLSDPHSWALSIPGTYGLPGLVFFILLIIGLVFLAAYCRGRRRAVAMIMLIMFLVKDLVSIPYIIGNTPLTFLIWLILSLLWVPPREQSRLMV